MIHDSIPVNPQGPIIAHASLRYIPSKNRSGALFKLTVTATVL